jgi:hypothetical protein
MQEQYLYDQENKQVGMVRWQDESGTGSELASVEVFLNGEPQLHLIASVEQRQGADGGWYSTIGFKRNKVG